MRLEEAPYRSAEHAISRAFSTPAADYGKMLDFSGVMSITSSLSPIDQAAQDGMARRLLEENLDTGQRWILYMVYDTTDERYHGLAALDMYTEIISHKNNRYFVLESVAKWVTTLGLKVKPYIGKEYQQTIGQWAAQYGVKRWELRDERAKIYEQLDGLFSAAQGAATDVLQRYDLIPD